ncbi:hypothetical protein CLHUN_34710 [Ruminiclostridium hungatei]|uniref:Stage III sporulation protein AC/AD protein family protein n=1 Tax=Ruminiclostridium hungatei TaxID=48256 RepID=A0A1V4SFI6_RUMHU|nr:hypothetical protein [Ruminiclostridium hungatei]OPX42649.1 hypothetical protein CLHUN_34710 [Ruminiclostridium hungatei]
MIIKIIALILFMSLISFFQIKQIYKKEGLKAALAYSLFMALAVLVGTLLLADFQLTGQSAVARLFEPLGKAVNGD